MNKNIFILIIAIALGAGLYYIVPKAQTAYNTYKAVESQKAAVASLQSELDNLKQKQQQEEVLAQQDSKPIYTNEAGNSGDALSSFGIMFEDIISAAKENKMKLFSIGYNTAPTGDVIYDNIKDYYNVCVVKLELIGTYSQFKSYFNIIYNYPYLINISKVELKPYERNKKILIGKVDIALYSKK